MARMTAGLDAAGMPLAWHVRMTGNSIMGMMRPIPRRRRQAFPGGLPGRHALRRPELSRRLCDAEHARAGRVLALRQPHAELLLQGKLHRRDGARRRPGSLPLPAQAARAAIRSAAKFLGVLDAAAAARRLGRRRRRTAFTAASRSTRCNGTFIAAVVEVSVGDGTRAHASRGQRDRLRAPWSTR